MQTFDASRSELPQRFRAEWEVLDARFQGIKGDTWVERLHTGCRWTEGPVYLPASRCLLWNDIPSNRTLRWDELTGHVAVFKTDSGNANGQTLDTQGRLVVCEHGARRVTRLEHSGQTTVLADRYQGKRLNSPNDVVVHSDGSVWFTDPAYGIDSDYEGWQASSEIGACHVYRLDAMTGELQIVADDFERPNGLCFSSDEGLLYIVDSHLKHLRVFKLKRNGRLSGGQVLSECSAGTFDGIRLDSHGRIWGAASDGLHCLDSSGALIGKLRLPEVASNLVFGGLKRNQLFVTATSSVYSLMSNVTGHPGVHAR